MREDLQPTPEKRPVPQESREKFDVYQSLHERKGAFIEIAGPTEQGYAMVDFARLEKKVWESNVYDGTPLYDTQTGEFIGYDQKVDFQADVRVLPFADGTIGAIFCSHLGTLTQKQETLEEGLTQTRDLREHALHEAFRALEKGGLLIWQGGTQHDLHVANHVGFALRAADRLTDDRGHERLNLIFEKP